MKVYIIESCDETYNPEGGVVEVFATREAAVSWLKSEGFTENKWSTGSGIHWLNEHLDCGFHYYDFFTVYEYEVINERS